MSIIVDTAGYWDIEYITNNSEIVRTKFFLSNIKQVREEVTSRSGVLLSAEPVQRRWFHKELFSNDFKLSFIRGLNFHIDAGVSPGQSLALVVQTITNPRIKSQLSAATDVLNNGGSFSEGLTALGLFNDAVIGMLVAGEISNDIKSAIVACEDYLKSQGVWLKAWKGFIIWVSTEITSAIGGLQFMSDKFIPDLIKNTPASKNAADLESYKSALEFAQLACQSIFWLTNFTLAAIVITYFVYRFGNKPIQDKIEKYLLFVPGAKSLLIDDSLALTYSLLSQMFKSRVKFSDALPLVLAHSKTPSVKEFWMTTKEKIDLGYSLANAFDHRFVDSTEKIILNAHGDIKQLAVALGLMAKRRHDESNIGRSNAIKFYSIVMFIYMAGVIALGFWLLKLQGAGLDMMSIEGVMGV